MPTPKDPTKPPRLRWSPEEIDRLVREAAMLMLAAERNGKPLTKSKAVALAQYVLPKERQRKIDSTFNPSWMASEGRIETLIEQLRGQLPAATPSTALPEPAPVPAPAAERASGPAQDARPVRSPATKSAPKSSKLREQAGLFPEPPPGRARRAKAGSDQDAAPAPAPIQAAAPAGDVPAEAAVPALLPEVAAAPELAPSEPAARPVSEAAPSSEPQAAPAPVAQQEVLSPPAVVSPQPPVPASQQQPEEQEEPDVVPAFAHALAGLGVDALAGALRTVATKALAGLLVDVLRQPEVQAALRDAVGSVSKGKPFNDRHQGESERRPGAAARDDRELRDPSRRQASSRPPPAPRAPEQREPRPQSEEPVYTREHEPDAEIEPVLLDPNAWQATPLNALPERTARGASDAPRPTVAVFGLLPKDQQRLKAEFGQRFKLRFGSAQTSQALDNAKDVDQIYAMVRFIPKDLDRGLAASGVPYRPLNSIGELRHELQVNPPFPRGELL